MINKEKSQVNIEKPDKRRWRRTQHHHKSVYGVSKATNELFFHESVNNSLGGIVAAGMGKHGKLANRWNTGRIKKLREQRYSLLMVLENSGGFYHNESGFECPLAYGDFCMGIPGGSHHTTQNGQQTWGEISVEFEGKIFDILHEEKFISFKAPVRHLEDPAPWIARLLELLRGPRPTTRVEAMRETTSFFMFLLEMLEASVPKTASPAPGNWFDNACTMLSSDLSKPLDLHAVAQKLGMGYENFRIQFRRQAGLPPGQYRDQQRCKAGCDKLLKTRKSCWEIALYLGFCDEQHFSRRFKKWTGLSPQAYRILHSKQNRSETGVDRVTAKSKNAL